MRYLLTAALLVFFFSCKRKKEAVQVSETAIATIDSTSSSAIKGDTLLYYFERTPCFGQCPIFKLSIYESGYSIYEGRNFVDRIGTYQSNGDLASLHKIKEVADSIQYFSFDSLYDNPNLMDFPSKIIIIKNQEEKKKVVARVKAPKSLEALYKAFDDYIDAQKWKPKQ